MDQPRTIVFFPEGAYGPTNNCVGIGEVLRQRGHRVVFIVEESFAGTLEAKGFEERLMRLGPPPAEAEVPGQFWKDFIRDTAPEFRKATIDQLGSFLQPTWQALIDGVTYVEPRLAEIFDELRPDVIVEDNVVLFPAILSSGRPWVRIVSCNPAEIRDRLVPPAYSGYPTYPFTTDWIEFEMERRRTHEPMWQAFEAYVRERTGQGLPNLEFMPESPFLNLYLYPREADYKRRKRLAPTWHRLDSCVRATDGTYDLPESLASAPGRLIYLSLGSLGSADIELMQRLIDLLGRTDHRAVVSMGPQHERLHLAENMVGAEFLPQPAILPQVDLVVTHGGNNTVTECFHNGLPMIVLPLFWDQYDNAQRVAELGFGVRLDTYRFDDRQLTDAVDGLLADRGLHQRLAAVSVRLKSDPGTGKAADLIEGLARGGHPVLRPEALRA